MLHLNFLFHPVVAKFIFWKFSFLFFESHQITWRGRKYPESGEVNIFTWKRKKDHLWKLDILKREPGSSWGRAQATGQKDSKFWLCHLPAIQLGVVSQDPSQCLSSCINKLRVGWGLAPMGHCDCFWGGCGSWCACTQDSGAELPAPNSTAWWYVSFFHFSYFIYKVRVIIIRPMSMDYHTHNDK